MKKIFASAAISSLLIASAANAGGMSEPMMEAEPMMEPEVVVEESTGSSGGFVLPLILLAVIVAVASSSDSDSMMSDG